jgi:hypothetical protein
MELNVILVLDLFLCLVASGKEHVVDREHICDQCELSGLRSHSVFHDICSWHHWSYPEHLYLHAPDTAFESMCALLLSIIDQ